MNKKVKLTTLILSAIGILWIIFKKARPISLWEYDIQISYFDIALSVITIPLTAIILNTFVPRRKLWFGEIFINVIIPFSVYYIISAIRYNQIIMLCIGIIFIVSSIIAVILSKKNSFAKGFSAMYIIRYIWLILFLSVVIPVNYYYTFEVPAIRYEASGTINKEILSEKEMYNKLSEELSESNWNKLNNDERLDVLQEIIDFHCRQLGIETPDVCVAELTSIGTMAVYSHTDKTICFNSAYIIGNFAGDIIESSAYELVLTSLHEVYHAYQYDSIDTLESIPTEYTDAAYFAKAKEWKRASENYSDDYMTMHGYTNNALEIGANAFAEAIIGNYNFD